MLELQFDIDQGDRNSSRAIVKYNLLITEQKILRKGNLRCSKKVCVYSTGAHYFKNITQTSGNGNSLRISNLFFQMLDFTF